VTDEPPDVDVSDDEALAAVCAETAKLAGQRVLAWRRQRRQVAVELVETKSSPTDMVTEADRLTEQLIRERLMAARPHAAWLGEESGADIGSGGADGLEWVVDPIDGTTNFLYDLPGWSVSIAARRGSRPVAGAVHVPTAGETFTAVVGRGAWLEDASGRRPMMVSTETDLSRALIATGFAYDEQTRTKQGRVVGRLVGRVRDIRRAGAASVDLCGVAAGRVDGYFERGLKPWDLAAGVLIASEAGARVWERPDGTTVAAGPQIADALTVLLDELDAGR
jgi:myo-inositol-1(or 4)-monophosphatase